jgi:NifU-like protein involved in Fe-S cluster formation
MNEVVASRYRELMQAGFPNAGKIEKPTVFVDPKAEGFSICGNGSRDYMNLYMNIDGGTITEIKYLCSCDPTANVVVEVLCNLARGKTLDQAKTLTREAFCEAIGTDSGIVARKVWSIVDLLNTVIKRYEVGTTGTDPEAMAQDAEEEWD